MNVRRHIIIRKKYETIQRTISHAYLNTIKLYRTVSVARTNIRSYLVWNDRHYYYCSYIVSRMAGHRGLHESSIFLYSVKRFIHRTRRTRDHF